MSVFTKCPSNPDRLNSAEYQAPQQRLARTIRRNVGRQNDILSGPNGKLER